MGAVGAQIGAGVQEEGYKLLAGGRASGYGAADELQYEPTRGCHLNFRSTTVKLVGMKMAGIGTATGLVAAAGLAGDSTRSCALSCAICYVASSFYYLIYTVRRQGWVGGPFGQGMLRPVVQATGETTTAQRLFVQEAAVDGFRQVDCARCLRTEHRSTLLTRRAAYRDGHAGAHGAGDGHAGAQAQRRPANGANRPAVERGDAAAYGAMWDFCALLSQQHQIGAGRSGAVVGGAAGRRSLLGAGARVVRASRRGACWSTSGRSTSTRTRRSARRRARSSSSRGSRWSTRWCPWSTSCGCTCTAPQYEKRAVGAVGWQRVSGDGFAHNEYSARLSTFKDVRAPHPFPLKFWLERCSCFAQVMYGFSDVSSKAGLALVAFLVATRV